MRVYDILPAVPADSDDPIGAMLAAACDRETRGADWHLATPAGTLGPWIEVSHIAATPPTQGWKLHVSAGVASAVEVLRRALPVLMAEPVHFKVAASLRRLYELNLEEGGRSQAGKFITIYPNDDAQAVRLAVALDEATRGLRGPGIPSDRPLRPGSVVHYRYGAFRSRYLQTPLGVITPAIEAPDGSLVPDRRSIIYHAPAWAVDPFVAAGVVERRPALDLLIGGRYLTVAVLQKTPRGMVRLAVDTRTGERRVLKQARRDSGVAPEEEADERLRHEAEVLRLLAPDPRVPTVYDLIRHHGDPVLVMEECTGLTVEQHVQELAVAGRFLSNDQIVAWGRELASLLGIVHDHGFIYNDLKSPNVIVSADGHLRLIDFETACRPGEVQGPEIASTPGFASPQRAAGLPPTIADDIYSLGALLYFMATSADPSHAPNQLALLDRPVALVNPGVDPGVARVIERCLAPGPAARFPSMAAVELALRAVGDEAPVRAIRPRRARAGSLSRRDRRRCRRLARRLANSICRTAEPVPDGPGVTWISTRASGDALWRRDLNSGPAGTVLVLAELATAFSSTVLRATLADAARWLAVAPSLADPPLPGLYVGEAGIGAALLRAGQVLGRRNLVTEAVERGRLVASLPYKCPDLFNGTAGRLRFHLLLWDATGDAEHLHAALAAGEHLLATAEDAGSGGLRWRIPPGYEAAGGVAYLGYAHGAAGIAHALLDLFEATGDHRFRDAARGAGMWLQRCAVPALDDGSGLDWPTTEDGSRPGALWCHGAAGVGRFFLHAARLALLPDADELAARAARTASRAARWAGPTQCHGLAGNAEFLIDVYQATGDASYLHDAMAMARLLEAFATERDGLLMWPSDTRNDWAPDYMVGYAGVAACLLRLSDPEDRPHLLSRAGFRVAAQRTA
jgi:hypothetical protein